MRFCWWNGLNYYDKSNFKQGQELPPDTKPEQIEKQLFDHIDHIGNKATQFDELLARIRDIRSSEKVFYRKVLDIYATSID